VKVCVEARVDELIAERCAVLEQMTAEVISGVLCQLVEERELASGVALAERMQNVDVRPVDSERLDERANVEPHQEISRR